MAEESALDRAPSKGWLIGFAIPFGIVLLWCFLMRPEWATLAAPAFGPWAGVLYGHYGCTLASNFPAAALGLAVLGGGLLFGAVRLRRRWLRHGALCFAILWAVGWELSAALSVANSCS